MLKEFRKDNLLTKVYETRKAMGDAGGCRHRRQDY